MSLAGTIGIVDCDLISVPACGMSIVGVSKRTVGMHPLDASELNPAERTAISS